MLYGGIEAGGTKFVCGISNEDLTIIKRVSFPTTTPQETLPKVIHFFQEYQAELAGIGVGAFGPIDVNQDSATYGFITSTPKLAWQNFDFVGTLQKALAVPIAFTTDVTALVMGNILQEVVKRSKV